MRAKVMVLVISAAIAAHAQAGGSAIIFEVASIKPSAPGAGRRMVGFDGGPGTADPGQITTANTSLRMLIARAYDVKPDQVAGPAWLETEQFDIVAKVPPGATREQVGLMIRNLLAERFHMAAHRGRKDMPAFALAQAKGGARLKASGSAPGKDGGVQTEPAGAATPRAGPAIGKDGFPVLPPEALSDGPVMSVRNGRARIQAAGATLRDLADLLSGPLERPVIDETGLPGKYDWTLYWTPERQGAQAAAGAASTGDSGPDLFTALQEQLGLRLVSKKAPVEVVVVDHMEKVPSGN